MMSEHKSGAYAYFNAALKNGYQKMLITKDNGCNQWYDTKVAKERYDAKTGKIGNADSIGKMWWFCEEIPGRFTKFPSLNVCGNKPKPK